MKIQNKTLFHLTNVFIALLGVLAFFYFLYPHGKTTEKGKLLVHSSENGSYEIYQIMELNPQKLKTNNHGIYNEPLELEEGEYLIFSECSKKAIRIERGKTLEIVTQSLQFLPPKGTLNSSHFLVECSKQEELTRGRLFKKTFTFRFFNKKEHLKVNKKNFTTNFTHDFTSLPPVKTISLASLRLMLLGSQQKNFKYFLSSREIHKSEIQAERLNSERLLLAGSYHLSLNGSEKIIHLTPGEKRVIEPATLTVKKPSKFVEKEHLLLLARSYILYLNESYRLFFDEETPVFSGIHTLSFFGSNESEIISIEEKERKFITPHSLTIDSTCSKTNKDCLGEKDVFLFSKTKEKFLQGKTDVSLFYFKEPIGVEFINSKGLTYWVPPKKNHLKMGSLILKPYKKFKAGLLSEFARVEPLSKEISGYSRDISHKKETKLDLIEGRYTLVLYLNDENSEEKKKVTFNIRIKGGDVITKDFPYYVSEKFMKGS